LACCDVDVPAVGEGLPNVGWAGAGTVAKALRQAIAAQAIFWFDMMLISLFV
jgi:hypothetical protein